VSMVIPTPFAIINLAHADESPYGDGVCWLRPPYLYTCFVLPVSSVLCLSLVFYVLVVVKVCSMFASNKADCLSSRCSLNKSVSRYNHKRVISLLFFSLCSLSLGWLFGVLLVLFKHDDVYKLCIEFLFCLFNSFHGVCLLIGQYMAQRYSQPVSTVTSQNSTACSSASVAENPDRQTSANPIIKTASVNSTKTERPISFVHVHVLDSFSSSV
jgi:hypothetical protein